MAFEWFSQVNEEEQHVFIEDCVLKTFEIYISTSKPEESFLPDPVLALELLQRIYKERPELLLDTKGRLNFMLDLLIMMFIGYAHLPLNCLFYEFIVHVLDDLCQHSYGVLITDLRLVRNLVQTLQIQEAQKDSIAKK